MITLALNLILFTILIIRTCLPLLIRSLFIFILIWEGGYTILLLLPGWRFLVQRVIIPLRVVFHFWIRVAEFHHILLLWGDVLQ
jgi:hypothetical protein